VRVIKPARKNDLRERQITCQSPQCGAVIGVRLHELKRVSDQRDGDAYVMICPECGQETWTDARIIDA